MKIILNDEDIIKLVYNAFVDGGLTEIRRSEIELKFHDDHYRKAKDKLKETMKHDTICYEDVLVQLFKDGRLKFIDHNCDTGYAFTPSVVMENLETVMSHNSQAVQEIMDSLNPYSSDCDCWTHYNIIQYMLFKGLIYG